MNEFMQIVCAIAFIALLVRVITWFSVDEIFSYFDWIAARKNFFSFGALIIFTWSGLYLIIDYPWSKTC